MSKANRMPGLRFRRGAWHIEKRCEWAPGGWLRESTGTSSRRKAEERLIRRLAEVKEEAEKEVSADFSFEKAGLRYLSEIAHKPSADNIARHLDQLFVFIGHLPLAQVHNGTIQPFIDHELERGIAQKSINNVLTVAATVLNRAAKLWRTESGRPWLTQAPATLSRLSLKGCQARPYPLSWSEQDRLMRELPRHLADATLFAVNTGCREQEVCQLRWSWELELRDLETSIFILPTHMTKTQTERVVAQNAIARRVIESRRGKHETHVFTYRGHPIGKLNNTAWKRAWRRAELPVEPMIRRGVHNLRHTFGRRLRGVGVSLETRKALLGHATGDITTHYSAAELLELITAVEKIVDRGHIESPNLMLLGVENDKECRQMSALCRRNKKALTKKLV